MVFCTSSPYNFLRCNEFNNFVVADNTSAGSTFLHQFETQQINLHGSDSSTSLHQETL